MSGPDSNNTDVLVRFRNVQKSYDGRSMIVKNLNLDIQHGEFLTLLGPSGSGKTTSLMMLAGFETPTSGTIELAGRSLDDVPAYKRNIGMVFQNYALFPHMTVAENLAFPLKVRGMGKDEIKKRVENGLAMVQLNQFGNRFPSQLSGGQQQRVALARALVFEPQVVLMDEPLGALDKQLREHMQYEIKRLHNKLGITVVYVTHDQGEALTMSDRVAVFNDGVIQQIDSPEELYERPVTAFVANFIGENNRTHGRITEVGNEYGTVLLDNGTQMQGVLANPSLKAGDMVSVSIRPERVVIDPPAGSTEQNGQGEILEFVYFGDHVRLRLNLYDNPNFVVKQPIAMLGQTLKVGKRINVGWKREFVRILDPYQ